MMDGCRLAVDIGGTFTDVVLETPKEGDMDRVNLSVLRSLMNA